MSIQIPEKVEVETRAIISAIHTLKSMADSGKVTGYENMDKLVGLVMLFDSMLRPQEEVEDGTD